MNSEWVAALLNWLSHDETTVQRIRIVGSTLWVGNGAKTQWAAITLHDALPWLAVLPQSAAGSQLG